MSRQPPSAAPHPRGSDQGRALAALRTADPVLASLIDRTGPVDLGAWRSRWSQGRFEPLARGGERWRPHRTLAMAYLYEAVWRGGLRELPGLFARHLSAAGDCDRPRAAAAPPSDVRSCRCDRS